MKLRRGRVNTVKFAGISTLVGDVVGGPGTGVIETTIPINTVTTAQMEDLQAPSLLGRGSNYGTGDPETITIGPGLQMVGTDLQAVPFAGAVFTFDNELKAYVTPRP